LLLVDLESRWRLALPELPDLENLEIRVVLGILLKKNKANHIIIMKCYQINSGIGLLALSRLIASVLS